MQQCAQCEIRQFTPYNYIVGSSPQNSALIRCNVCSYVYVCIYFSLYIMNVHAFGMEAVPKALYVHIYKFSAVA